MDINTDAPVITRDEIHISADIQTNVTDWPSWQPDVDGAESDGPLTVGSVFRWQTAGLDITSTVEEVDPPRRIVWGGPAQGIIAVHVWTFDERGDGVLVRTAESWEGDAVTAQPETLQPPRWLIARLARESQARSRTRGARIAADASLHIRAGQPRDPAGGQRCPRELSSSFEAEQVSQAPTIRLVLVANLGNRAIVDGRDLWRDQTVGLLCRGCGSRGCACWEPDPR
jgi:hypothetical protein